jgi:molybdenum cofactor cytidylyltransferase
MGQHKLLLELAGQPVAAWSVRAACASQARDVLVVLGRGADSLAAALPHERERTIYNPDFAHGQGTSLARAVTDSADSAPGLIILLADQPFMDRDSIDLVVGAANTAPDKIIVGSVGGDVGHPVYLPRRVFADLKTPGGDHGARNILARERGQLVQVALSNVYAHLDVDTPEDYARAAQLAYLLAPAAS